MEQRQLDELITPPTEHPSLTVGKIYGALLMFEHWRAFKNRQQEREEYYPAGTPTLVLIKFVKIEGGNPEQKPTSRAESFASLVSNISHQIQRTKSQLSLRPGDIHDVKQLSLSGEQQTRPTSPRKSVVASSKTSMKSNFLLVPEYNNSASNMNEDVQSPDTASPDPSEGDDEDYPIMSSRRQLHHPHRQITYQHSIDFDGNGSTLDQHGEPVPIPRRRLPPTPGRHV